MTRFLPILLALTCAASAQTYRTVTADTNNVIRTNFSLVRAQVSDLDGATFAISNITGLQTALDGKLATNGSAAGLTNFPASILTTNSAASSFPAELLRTNGDGSGLTNLPNADLGSATGILPIANGGTGSTNASAARTALELGSAATNDATAFQPASTNLTALSSGDGSSLTNVTITDASTLTNFPAELLRTNGDGSGLTGIAVYPTLSNNAGLVLAVTTNETGVEWIAVSNTVTDASTLTNFPASILQTNSADGSFPSFLARTNADASGFTNFPTLNQNTTGTASNVTGIVQITNGGTGTNSAAGARVNLLPSYTGNSNKVLAVNAGETDVEWVVQSGGGGGTVDLSTTNATGVLPVAKGGTGGTNKLTALLGLSVYGSTFTNAVDLSIEPDFGTIGDTIVRIGYSAEARAESAVAIGPYTDAEKTYSTAVGRSARGNGTNSIALGYGARGNATDATQIGLGTNSTPASIQFLSAGVVDTNEWAALANAGTIGTNVLQSTNAAGAQAAIFPATTTNAPTNTNAPTPDAWLDVTVGTNAYKLPLWQ